MTNTFRSVLFLLGGACLACAALPETLAAEELPAPVVRRSSRATSPKPASLPVRSARTSIPRTTIPQTSIPQTSIPQTVRPALTTRPAALPVSGPRNVAVDPSAGAVPVAPVRAKAAVPAPRADTRRAFVASVPVRRAPAPALTTPEVRRVSPSYAELERTRPSTILRRERAGAPKRSTPRRATRRAPAKREPVQRSPDARRCAPRAQQLTVPLAPGQCAPKVPTRRRMLLRPVPGCCGDG